MAKSKKTFEREFQHKKTKTTKKTGGVKKPNKRNKHKPYRGQGRG